MIWSSGKHEEEKSFPSIHDFLSSKFKLPIFVYVLGFEYAELSHGIRISLLPGILDAVDAGVVKISSVHNFCPLPVGIDRAAPNIFQFSSDNRREQENAFRYTLKSIETAARVKAPVLVLHM